MPAGGGWDETGSSYRYRVRDPEDFQDGMFRTIAFGDSGIKAVVGKLPGEDTMTMQTLIFPKDKFTLEEARKWVKEHPDAIKKIEKKTSGRLAVEVISEAYKDTFGAVPENPPVLSVEAYNGPHWAEIWHTGMDWDSAYFLVTDKQLQPKLIAHTKNFGAEGYKVYVKELGFDGEKKIPKEALQAYIDKLVGNEVKKSKKDEWAREGYIIKSDTKKRYTLGVVYEPNVEDSQGEWSDEEEIEKACWNFMRYLQGKSRVTKSVLKLLDLIVKGLEGKSTAVIDIADIWEDIQKAARGLGYMHEEWGDDIGDIVECYTAPVDMTINDQHIQKGTWLMGVVWSPEYFKKVEKGEITGFSMGGRGRRIYE